MFFVVLLLCLVKLYPSLFVGLYVTSMLEGRSSLDAISEAVYMYGRVILVLVFIGCFMLVCFYVIAPCQIKCAGHFY